MAFPRIGPTIPGLGVDYVSPAVSIPRQNAINIRSTGATTGEAARFARLAPKGTTTKPAKPVSVAEAIRNTGATTGEANRFAALAPSGTTVTSTGAVVVPDRPVAPPAPEELVIDPGASGDSGTGDGDGGTGGAQPDLETPSGGDSDAGIPEREPGMTDAEYAALLQSTIEELLRPSFFNFQGQQASELRRLQNLYNQLYGTEEGMIGSIQRQRTMDEQARRRLAAQRATAGMLQGGAYAGAERGLGTIQQAQQAYALQEMQRPFREQTQSDRLREFGLSYDPEAAAANRFNLMDWQMYDPEAESWATSTYAGKSAYETARSQAIRELLARGISI